MLVKVVLFCTLFFALSTAEIFFSEEFGAGWENRWVKSQFKKDAGEMTVSAGKFYGDAEADKGLKTTEDARFYQISAEFKEFSNKDKDLILQFSVKHEQNIDCGGGYFKIIPAGLDQLNFNGDSNYNLMFGPDICGSTKRVHAILNYKGNNHLIKSPEIRAESDDLTHLYTLIVHPDQTFEVLVDSKSVRKGSLLAEWDFLPPKEIEDPAVTKPADWVDVRQIADPAAVKPAKWDDTPKQIKDKDATKPEDWDAELDGEWESPLIDNPDYKGEWKAPMIPNPDYKGEWVHPKIPNPEYKEDDTIGKYVSNKYIGLEIWQVKSGTIFDNILVTDSVAEARTWAEKTNHSQEAEKAMKKIEQEAAKAAKSADETKEDSAADLDLDDDAGLDDEALDAELEAGAAHDEL